MAGRGSARTPTKKGCGRQRLAGKRRPVNGRRDESALTELTKSFFDTEARAEKAVLSTQVLQEFYVNATRKLETPLPAGEAEARVSDFAELPLIQVDARIILAAISRIKTMSISFWDALIVEAALKGGAKKLLTEDLQHGQTVDGLRIENPFI